MAAVRTLAALCALAPPALAQEPIGDPFQVSTSAARGGPTAVGIDAAGNFVVVWESVSDGSAAGVAGRRFDPSGNPLGPEFRVNTTLTGEQAHPDVAVADTGEFVVVWRSADLSGGPTGVFAQRFDATGAPLGPEFQVNTYTTIAADNPAVAADPRGGFVVTWDGYASAAERQNIYARRFDASGAAGAEFRVNEDVSFSDVAPALGVDGAGNLVVSWFGHDRINVPHRERGVYRRIDASDAPIGGDVVVNGRFRPEVGVARDGGFAVVWANIANLGWYARSFDASGTVLGPDTTLAGFNDSYGWASLAMSPGADAEFVVAWATETYDYDTEGWYNFRIQGRAFDRRGRAFGGFFQASPVSPTEYVGPPDAALNASQQFIVVWTEASGGPTRVLARRLGAGRLTGTVTDAATGLPVVGAQVSGAEPTDSQGRYLDLRPAGTYDLTVNKTGYATATASGVTLTLGQTTVQDFALQGAPVFASGGASIDDSGPGGNGNGVIDPNERFLIRVVARNVGFGASVPASATLRSFTPWLAITQPSASYPGLAPGAESAGDVAFEAVTWPEFNGLGMRLHVNLSSSQGTSGFSVYAPIGPVVKKMAFSGTGPVEIPDMGFVAPGVVEIPVSGVVGPIWNFAVRMHVTHPSVQDLRLELRGPNGASVLLSPASPAPNGFTGQDLGIGCPAGAGNTTLTNRATRTIAEGTAPYAGAFKPAQSLGAFEESRYERNGTWRLEATDFGSPGLAGRIECARILFDALSPSTTGGYWEIRVAGTARDASTGSPLAGVAIESSTGFSTVTGADGRYVLDVLPGTMDVTASAAGYGSATVTGVVASMASTQTVDFALSPVILSASAVVEDGAAGGNGNGVVDGNERFHLNVSLANAGSAAATGVAATLATTTPGVSIHQATSAYPSIPAGGAGANSTPFELQTGAGFVPGRALDLRLTVTTAQGTLAVPLTMPTGAPLAFSTAFAAQGPVQVGTSSSPGTLAIPVSELPSVISRVALQVYVKQSQARSLNLALEGPDGTSVSLVRGLFDSIQPGADYGSDCPAGPNDTTFDDRAPGWITAAPAPRAGSFRPIEPLARFIGKDPNGIWRLKAHASSIRGTIECARLLIWGYDSADAVPPSDRIFADGFDTGDLLAWSDASVDGGDLRASAAAAMAGTAQGLEAVMNDLVPVYVRDVTPASEPRYRARFYLDANDFDPGEAVGRHRVVVFMAQDEAPARRVVELVLRRLGGAYSLQARVRLDDGTRAETPFVPIGDGPHVVEMDWVKATAPGAADGSFQLWVDGEPTPRLTGLQTHDSDVDFARMGVMVIKAVPSGSLYFDRFDSRRESYIGP